jgi:hypothetical protein
METLRLKEWAEKERECRQQQEREKHGDAASIRSPG